ncbi:MAG: beta-phosphoglucomutase [Rhodothalassiaceae bacterium]
MTSRYRAALFDLDGVLADSAQHHYRAWKRLAAELGIALDEAFNERLKGVDRMGSLDLILSHGGRSCTAREREALAARKNDYYREQVAHMTPDDLLPGAREALLSCRAAGMRTALASASRNAPMLIERLGIADLFDGIADPALAPSKPDPGIFRLAAGILDVAPEEAIAIDDAEAGVAAAKAAGCFVIGIGDPSILRAADLVLPDIKALDIARLPR